MGALRPRQRLGYRGCHCEPASQRRCGNPPDIPGTLIGFVDDALIVLPHTPSTYAIGAMRASPPTSSIRRLPQSALIRLALAGDARATFPVGEGLGRRIATPALRRWFAMTCCIRKRSEKPKDCDQRESPEGFTPMTYLLQSPRNEKRCPAERGIFKKPITAGFPGSSSTGAPSAPPGRR